MIDLRTTLRLDALASGALGIALLALAGVLDDLLGLPVALALGAGVFLLVWAGFCAWVGTHLRHGAVVEVVVLNAVWVAASVAYAAFGGLTALGVAIVLAQAAAVVGFAVLQGLGLRRAGSPANGARASVPAR